MLDKLLFLSAQEKEFVGENLPEPGELLQAHAQIGDCLHKYCSALDDRCWARLGEVFHDDAHVRLSAVGGTWREYVTQARELLLSATEATQHQIGNTLLVCGPSAAISETYVTAHHVVRPDAPKRDFLGGTGARHDFIVGSIYRDRFERREGLWKIALRQSRLQWTMSRPMT